MIFCNKNIEIENRTDIDAICSSAPVVAFTWSTAITWCCEDEHQSSCSLAETATATIHPCRTARPRLTPTTKTLWPVKNNQVCFSFYIYCLIFVLAVRLETKSTFKWMYTNEKLKKEIVYLFERLTFCLRVFVLMFVLRLEMQCKVWVHVSH